jgi:hypothetical protein
MKVWLSRLRRAFGGEPINERVFRQKGLMTFVVAN